MAEHRAHPPSPRRRALARRAGLHAASPILVGATATAATIAALAVLGRAAVHRIGEDIAHACASAPSIAASTSAAGGPFGTPSLGSPLGSGPLTTQPLGSPGILPTPLGSPAGAGSSMTAAIGADSIVDAVLAVAVPILAIAAIAALAAHLAQTRAGWLPRRRVDHAPALPADAGARTRRTSLDMIAATVIAFTGIGWLWWAAPKLAALPTVPLAAGALVISGLAALAIAWLVLGAGDALLRHAALSQALHMTAREQRDDARASAVDPRWRALARKLARTEVRDDAIAGATLVVLGDGLAVAIAWDPVRRPIPHRLASGSDIRATQLLGLARRFGVPVHREPELARALAGTGPVGEDQWPRLAEIVAAVRR